MALKFYEMFGMRFTIPVYVWVQQFWVLVMFLIGWLADRCHLTLYNSRQLSTRRKTSLHMPAPRPLIVFTLFRKSRWARPSAYSHFRFRYQLQLQFVAAITGGENGIRPCIIIVLTMERRGPSVVANFLCTNLQPKLRICVLD